MATNVNKIDSNVTGLRIAEELSYKTLPGTPTWVPYEPNSYKDFGGDNKTVARQPINDGRQKKKGVLTDLDSAGGFETDLTVSNIADLLQGFMFADYRKKTEFTGSAITVSSPANTYGATGIGTNIAIGDLVFMTGFANAANNGLHRVTATAANLITVAETLVAEVSATTAKMVEVGIQSTAGDLDVSTAGSLPAITSTTVNFTTLGLIPGEWIYVGDDTALNAFSNAANNGYKRIKSVSANSLTIDKSDLAMVTEANTTQTVRIYYGRVLKNEIGSSIKRRTYQLERTLGAPDTTQPTQIQSQYVVGAVPDQAEFNIKSADKITVGLSFVGADVELRTGVQGVKSGNRPTLVDGNAMNTSSDFSRIKMAQVSQVSAAPTSLFTYVTDLTLTINNNVEGNKAVGVLGNFDATAGIFEVGGKCTAYFTDVAGLTSIRNNVDVTFDVIMARDNAGIAIDLPLIGLGGGRPDVQLNKPIELPLDMMAATASSVDTNMNHTLMMVFFDYLPTVAM